MDLNNLIFIDRLPKLDLHGFDRETARLAINDYINDKLKEKIDVFVIVHGKGQGILRETTYHTLSKNKNVLEFKSFYYNNGCTLVKIKI